MKVHEMQDNDGSHIEMFEQLIADKTRDWNNKKIDDAHYHSQLSLCYGNLFRAEECKRHAALVPDDAREQEKSGALHSVARILVYENDLPGAINYLEQAYAISPDYVEVVEEAGWCCLELKQWEAAEAWFRKAVIIEDDFENCWEGLALSLAHQDKLAEALPAFQKALEFCNQEYNGYIYLHLIGQCYAGLNDLYRALAYYTKSLDAKPTYANALNDMAAVYYNQDGDMEKAIYYLKKAEPVAEEENNIFTLQLIYRNLTNLYGQVKEFEQQQYYHAKLMNLAGLGSLFGYDDDDGDVDDEEEDGDEDKDA